MIAIIVPIFFEIIFGGNAVYDDFAARHSVESADYVHKRGFAAAGLSEYTDESASFKIERDAFQSVDNRVPRDVILLDVGQG